MFRAGPQTWHSNGMCGNLPGTVQCCLTLKLMVAAVRCRKCDAIDGRKYRSVDWFGREVSNSLRSCGLSETLLFYVYANCAIANLIDISGLSIRISCSKIIK